MAWYYLKICLGILLLFIVSFFAMDWASTKLDKVAFVGAFLLIALCFFSAKGLWAGYAGFRQMENYPISFLLTIAGNGIIFLISGWILVKLLIDLVLAFTT